MTERKEPARPDERVEKLAKKLREIRSSVLVPPAIEALPAMILIDKIAEAQAKDILANYVSKEEHERIVRELKKEHRKACLTLMNPIGRFR